MISLYLAAAAQAALAQPSEALLNARRGDEDIIPAYFQGRWAATAAECNNPDSLGLIEISATRIEGYESDHKLLKTGGVWSATAPNGKPSHYTELLLASSGEGRVFLGTLVLSRVGDTLYVRAKEGSEDLSDTEQYEFPKVRCSTRGAR